MAIIRWRPWLDSLEEMDRFFEDWTPAVSKGFVPAMDVYQTKDSVVVETPLAGVDPKDVNISVQNDVLTIEGKTEKKSEVEEKDYYRKEVKTGSFHRSVSLPVSVEGSKAKAEFENGILKVVVPKAAQAKPKSIKVQVKKSKK